MLQYDDNGRMLEGYKVLLTSNNSTNSKLT